MKYLILSILLIAALTYGTVISADTGDEPEWIVHFLVGKINNYQRGDVPLLEKKITLEEVLDRDGNTIVDFKEAYQKCMDMVEYYASGADSTWMFGCWPIRNPDYVDGKRV